MKIICKKIVNNYTCNFSQNKNAGSLPSRGVSIKKNIESKEILFLNSTF